MHLRLNSIVSSFVLGSAFVTPASAAFTTGFETPPYASGELNGQDTWSGSTPATARVLTATEISDELTAAGLNVATPVHGGSQAAFVTGSGGSSSTFRPITGMESETHVVMDIWARPLTPGTSGSTVGASLGNTFVTMEDASGVRAAAFRFGFSAASSTATLDYGTADQSGTWRPTGIVWQADTWYHLTMDVDYTSKTYDFFVDGTKINATSVSFYNTTSANFAQARVFRGSGQAGLIADDLSVNVPEPAGLALAGFGTAGLLARRRRPCR